MPRTAHDDRQRHLIWWLLGLLTLLRLLYALVYPLDLSGDETYYWDWGRQPDWGYFSKPPLIAWIMALLRIAGWDTPTGMRLLAAVFSAAVPALVYGFGRALYGVRIGLWGAALTALTPANAVLGLALVPDTLLILCWCGAMWAFWRWHRTGGMGSAFVLGACLNCGLLAKQSMLAFYPLALLYLVSSPDTRRLLLRPGTWLMATGSLACILPTLAWNSGHDWITLAHTGHHFTATPFTMGQVVKNLGELFGAHILLAGPVTWGMLALSVLLAPRQVHAMDRPGCYLTFMGALPLLLGTLLAVRQEVQPNWLLPFFPAALLGLLAYTFAPGREASWRPWLRRGLGTGALFMVATYALPWLPLERGVAGREVDILHGLRGWETAARQVQAVRERIPTWEDTPILVYGHRFFVSELAYYLPDRPRVYRWPWRPGRIESQYELWSLPPAGIANNALIISTNDKRVPRLPPSLRRAFESIEPLRGLDQDIGGGRERHYRLYRGAGWRGFNPVLGQ